MNYRFILGVAIAAFFLGSSGVYAAAENQAEGQVVKKKASKSKAKGKHKHKPAAKVKLVDINSATKAELMKLPGIGDAEADKIVAARPYGSKAWLASHKVIPENLYMGIKGMIVATQPFDDADKNAALYKKK